MNYNLDLSFARARSIFNYVFDTDKITFKHQRDLLPIVKGHRPQLFGRRRRKRPVESRATVPGERATPSAFDGRSGSSLNSL